MDDQDGRGRRLVALRGATTVAVDEAEAIVAASAELLGVLARENRVSPAHLVSAVFTATPDLTAAFPAEGARRLGWDALAVLCGVEIAVRGALPRCIRVMLHAELPVGAPPRHAYLRDAATLRPDRA
jgi:chorismate mutase